LHKWRPTHTLDVGVTRKQVDDLSGTRTNNDCDEQGVTMRRSESRCDTIIDLIDHCLAEYDAVASRSRRDDCRSPRGQHVMTPSDYLVNA
jgi:hypothetical protein